MHTSSDSEEASRLEALESRVGAGAVELEGSLPAIGARGEDHFSLRVVALGLFILGLLILVVALLPLVSSVVGERILHVVSTLKGIPPRSDWPHKLTLVLGDALVLGTVVMLAGIAIAKREWLRQKYLVRTWRLTAAAGCILLIQGLVALISKSFLLGQNRIWFLDDDAMISMRYGYNLAAGNGLVWNIGERVEGYSNFLWTIVMSLVHLLPISDSKTSLCILLLNIFLTILLLERTDRLATDLSPSGSPPPMLTIVLAVLSTEIILWSASGLETVALALLVTASVTFLVRSNRTARDEWFAGCLIALMPLIRADAGILAVLLIALGLVCSGHRQRLIIVALVATLPAVAHLAFRWSYYGELVPNTAYLKVSNWGARTSVGLSYVRGFAGVYWLVLALAGFAIVRMRNRMGLALAGALACYGGYVAMVGGDAFQGYRFLVPILPLLFILAGLTQRSLPIHRVARAMVFALVLVVTPILLPSRLIPHSPGLFSALSPSFGDTGNVQIGLWLRENTDSSATVGDFWAGSVFYFSRRRGVDFLGKMDPRIARMPTVCENGSPGHNKYDYAYSLGTLHPDFVVGGIKEMPDGRVIGPSGQTFTTDSNQVSKCDFFNALLVNDSFVEYYRDNIANNDYWLTVFRRLPESPRLAQSANTSSDDKR
jgi:arabinofuranosyltransferase